MQVMVSGLMADPLDQRFKKNLQNCVLSNVNFKANPSPAVTNALKTVTKDLVLDLMFFMF